MKRSFASRRVPRKIAQDDEHAASDASSANDSSASSAVKRPSQKHRKSSALRASFAAAEDDDHDDPSNLITPKRSNLSRLAIQRNAEKRSDFPFRANLDSNQDRPSYSRDYLDELKQSTPSTPRDVASLSATDTDDPDLPSDRPVDIASKFGSDLSRYQPPTAIPTDAEIQEKKARRARLAKENDFISLDDDQDDDDDDDDAVTRDDQGRLILKPKEKYPETRLVQEDEDMLEGFDDFTTDGKIAFGRKAQKEEDQRRRAEMASLIAAAEGQSADGDQEEDDDDDESEAERNAAFEVAQTRHGTYATRDQQDGDSTRPQTPPKVVPIPTLDTVVERLRQRLQEMEMLRANKANEMQSLVREKTQIGEEEIRVQAALKETGEKYQKLREDTGLQTKEQDDAQLAIANGNQTDSPSDGEEEVDDERPGLGTAGLGSGMQRDMADWGLR